MKRGVIFGLAMLCAIGVQAVEFTNLNFEAYSGTGDDYLPGWEGSTNIGSALDFCPLVTASWGLVSSNGACATLFEGEYSAFFSSGEYQAYINEELGWMPVCCTAPTISQTAQVPTNATQIRYSSTPTWIKDPWDGGHWEIRIQGTLGGIELSAGTPTDISSLAGQTLQLSFTLVGGDSGTDPGSWHSMDQIEFLDGSGEVVWPPPPPYGPSARCLEDFHAGLNTSLWQIITVGQELSYSEVEPYLGCYVNSATDSFETVFQYQPVFRGDWDVLIRYELSVLGFLTGTGNIGMGLCAELGSGDVATACVGQIADPGGSSLFYMTDWGSGPFDLVSSTTNSGMFRLHREGETVSGLYWDSVNTCWQTVGSAGGFTQESARVGLKVWNTGTFSGKGSFMPNFDDLMLVDGQVCLDGMAVKVFGLDSNGVPSVSWDSVGIAETNRYFVTKATNLLDPDWEAVSGALGESAESNQWTGSALDASPVYYRIEVAPE